MWMDGVYRREKSGNGGRRGWSGILGFGLLVAWWGGGEVWIKGMGALGMGWDI
jgi:hypothetical protein